MRRQRIGQYINHSHRAVLDAARALLRRHAARQLAPVDDGRVQRVTNGRHAHNAERQGDNDEQT